MAASADNKRKHSIWVYFLPCLHLCGCSMLPIGYVLHFVTRHWDYIFGFAWIIVMLVDLPVSLVAYALSWKYGVLAAAWIFAAGTWWWYFLSGVIERVVESFRHRNEINTLNVS